MSLLINYRDIVDSSYDEIMMWDDWRYDLSVSDIIKWLGDFYDLFIKDVYNIHFLTGKQILNLVLCIQDDIEGLKTYLGSEGELLVMFSIVMKDSNVVNLKRVSNIIPKSVIIRDIKLNKIILLWTTCL